MSSTIESRAKALAVMEEIIPVLVESWEKHNCDRYAELDSLNNLLVTAAIKHGVSEQVLLHEVKSAYKHAEKQLRARYTKNSH